MMDSLATWAAVLIAGALSAVAIVYVLRPILTPGPAAMVLEDDKLVDMLRRKDAALKAIKDLEFDYRVGKVSDEDYRRLDQSLRRQAIVLMQQVEKLAPRSSTLDDRLEAEIAAQRKSRPPQPEAVKPATVPVPAAGRATNTPARYCTNCGNLLEPSHKFCANCGTPVAVPALVAGDGSPV